MSYYAVVFLEVWLEEEQQTEAGTEPDW
jgi:hypothetical protein